MNMLYSIYAAIRDLLVRLLPARRVESEYRFGFIVHARDHRDVLRRYPFFKYLPKIFSELLTRHLWPVVISEITGLKSRKSDRRVRGWNIAVPLTARQMMENRKLALKRILQAAVLAKKMGIHIIGLGALTSSLSKGGLDITERVDIGITTGHAYTAYNVTQNLFRMVEMFGLDKNKLIVAVVGATGSIGSTSSKIIAREGFKNLLLIDVERKKHAFADLTKEINALNPEAKIEISHQIGSIKVADFILTATNAPEAVIRPDDLKSGAVVIDDAQPSDVAPEVLDREDVLVVEAGVAHTPGIKSNFNFGLKDREDNFSCLAEVMVLASEEWKGHYVVNRATLEYVDQIRGWGRELGFCLGKFQNFKERISDEKLEAIKNIALRNDSQL